MQFYIQITISSVVHILCGLHILAMYITIRGDAILREKNVVVARCRRLGIAGLKGRQCLDVIQSIGNSAHFSSRRRAGDERAVATR